MARFHLPGVWYGLFFGLGFACLLFAHHQSRYVCMVRAGHHAVATQRFDSQEYERASQVWLAKRNVLLFNQGVLAFQARNLPRAADFFRRVSQRATHATLRVQSLYNLGMVMLALDETQRATEFFKAALRLDPHDTDTKFNLERLLHIVLREDGAHGEASFKQAPGVERDGNESAQDGGHGRSRSELGI